MFLLSTLIYLSITIPLKPPHYRILLGLSINLVNTQHEKNSIEDKCLIFLDKFSTNKMLFNPLQWIS